MKKENNYFFYQFFFFISAMVINQIDIFVKANLYPLTTITLGASLLSVILYIESNN